jgi:hypothetical protein
VDGAKTVTLANQFLEVVINATRGLPEGITHRMRVTDSLTKNRLYEVRNSEGTDLRRFSVTIVERSTGVTAP